MRVEATKQVASGQSNGFTDEFARDREGDDSSAPECRALVVTETRAAAPNAPVYREAAFLAHLIATSGHAPQTRERRRAEPLEAIAAYRTVTALTRG